MRRNGNNEGSIYYTVEKHKRKKFREEGECSICKNCTDRTLCEGRTGWIKCQKCKDCKTECLKYCDRFDCYGKYNAQITIDGKQTTVGASKKRKEAANKKLEAEAKAQTNNYIQKNSISLLDVIKKMDDEKLEIGIISESTKYTNSYRYNTIKSIGLDLPIQDLNSNQIQKALNELKYLSQSVIEKIYDMIKSAFKRCVLDKIIAYSDNPMEKVIIPRSIQNKNKIETFEVHEQIKLMKYLCSNSLILHHKSMYDIETIKNIILTSFLFGTRIGELGAINYEEDIDWDKNCLIIRSTLSKDKNGNVILSNYTKTGRKKEENGDIDERKVPFDIFDKDLATTILKNQIEIAKKYPNNTNKLLFLKKDGTFIKHNGITNILKRICRMLQIKTNLPKGCHIHMTRHTFVTRLIEADVDLMVIAKLVGHSNTRQIQKTYGHILPQYMESQLNKARTHYSKNELLSQKFKDLNTKKSA